MSHNVTKSDQEAPSVRFRLNLPFGTCRHLETMVVRSAGVERLVCEACGHVSFSFDVAPMRAADLEPVTPIHDLAQPAEV